MPYLVDGNNLAHVLGLSQGGLADRAACEQVVATFCRSRGARATIIFDGPAEARERTATPGQRVQVEFSQGRSADDVILRRVTESRTPADLTVVTSDKSLGDKARHRGASVERAHEFARRLERPAPSKPGRASGKSTPRESPEQIEAWLAVFDPRRK